MCRKEIAKAAETVQPLEHTASRKRYACSTAQYIRDITRRSRTVAAINVFMITVTQGETRYTTPHTHKEVITGKSFSKAEE